MVLLVRSSKIFVKVFPPLKKDKIREAVNRDLEKGKLWAPFGFNDDSSLIVLLARAELYLDYAKDHPDWFPFVSYVNDLGHHDTWIKENLQELVRLKILQANDKLELRLHPSVQW